jgi:MYXO-CTERM domain-containing protein
VRARGRWWGAWVVGVGLLALGGRAGATDCTGNDDCLPDWKCDLLSGTCQGPAGAGCSHAGGCQGNICAGGRCCAEPCAYEHPECGGACDETGACVYPPIYTGCTCDGGTALCWHGACQCAQADAGTAADAAVDEPSPATLCGCRAVSRPAGVWVAVIIAALAPRRRRRRPRGRAVRIPPG